MRQNKRVPGKKFFGCGRTNERGVALIVVILVLAFMFTVGLALFSVTRTGPTVSGNMRWHQMVFNAAEAGVDSALVYINQNVADFYGQYRTTYNGQPGFDDPSSPNYFRRLTDEQILADLKTNADSYIYSLVPMPYDNDITYSAFLIDNNVGSPTPDHTDAVLVCIAHGPQKTSVRLEITIGIQ